jgi:hypothetical protein
MTHRPGYRFSTSHVPLQTDAHNLSLVTTTAVLSETECYKLARERLTDETTQEVGRYGGLPEQDTAGVLKSDAIEQ